MTVHSMTGKAPFTLMFSKIVDIWYSQDILVENTSRVRHLSNDLSNYKRTKGSTTYKS